MTDRVNYASLPPPAAPPGLGRSGNFLVFIRDIEYSPNDSDGKLYPDSRPWHRLLTPDVKIWDLWGNFLRLTKANMNRDAYISAVSSFQVKVSLRPIKYDWFEQGE